MLQALDNSKSYLTIDYTQFSILNVNSSKHATLNTDIRAPTKPRKKLNYKSKDKVEVSTAKLSLRDEQLAKIELEKNKQSNRRSDEANAFYVRVLLKKVVSPDEIYVSQQSSVAAFEDMNRQMQKFYSENRGIVEGPPEKDMYYCVYSRKDNEYCRALFLEFSDTKPNKATVLLVDHVDKIEVDVDEIQALNRRFIELPLNMFRIKIPGVTPCGDSKSWPSSSCRKLKEIIENCGCDTKYYITLTVSGPSYLKILLFTIFS